MISRKRGAAALSDEHEHGFLKGRALDFFRLDAPVRRIVLTTGVVLLGVALACALRENFPGPVANLPDGFIVPLVVILVAAATITFGLTLLIAGAAHARTRWRYALLLPIAICLPAAMLAALTTVGDAWPNWLTRTVIVATIALPVILLGIAAFFGPRVRVVPLFWVVLALTAACTAAIILISVLGTPAFGESFVLYLVGVGAVALEPALLVVGFDIADIGADFATLGARFAERKNTIVQRIARIAAIVLAGGAAVWMFYLAGLGQAQHFAALGWFFALAAAVVLVAFLAARRAFAPVSGASLQYHYLLLVAAAVTIASLVISFSSEPMPGLFSTSGLRSYSFQAPQGLKEFGERFPAAGHMTDPRTPTRVMFIGANGWPLIAVVGVPRLPFALPTDHFSSVNGMIYRLDLAKMPVPATRPGPDWTRSEAATHDLFGKPAAFAILSREVPTQSVATDMNWYIICGDVKANLASAKSICEAIAASFETQARKRTSRSLAMIFDLLFFLAAFGALALAQYRGRKGDTAGLDFVFWACFLNGLRGIAGYAGAGLDYAFYDTNVSALLISTMLAAAAAFALVLEFWPRARGFDISAARNVAGRAAASMLVLAGLFALYVFAIRGSDESQIIRGVIICFALLWELVMSGERLNLSAEHHLFPRSSRVFILVGYLLMVSTVVFLMTGLLEDGGKSVAAWNSELFVANGIALLGGALIINRAVRGFAKLRAGAPPLEETQAYDPQ
jgi:hypothetical protein